MATSPLFGWEEPDDTDLVKDGAAAIRTLGNAIDTSMGDLLGGTTGQVLSKNSNTSMDFTWVTSDDANAIQNAIVDAKGDLITATAADTPARLAVGTNDYFLQAASGQATGLQWGGSWSTWTPTLVQGVTVTATVAAARYMKIGKMITGQVLLVATSTGTANNNIKVTLPFAALTGNSFVITGGATIYDASTTLVYPGFSAVVDGTYFQLPVSSAIVANGGQYLGNNQFTLALASGDYVAFGFTYEVA
jgi:hypothetical protein